MIATFVTSSHGWSPLLLHLPMDDCHFGYIYSWMITTFVTWLPLLLHLPMDDHHLWSSIGRLSKSGNPPWEDVSYIFPWMITTLATSSHGWLPLLLHLPMDDCHFCYIFPWMIDCHFCYIFPWMITWWNSPQNQKRKRKRRRKRSLRNAGKVSDFLSFPHCAVWATRDL